MTTGDEGGRRDRTVYALTGSEVDAAWLDRGCEACGLEPTCFDNLMSLGSALRAGSTDRLILFTACLTAGQSLSDVIELLRNAAQRPLRVICFAQRDDLGQRLEALRAGCVGFHRLPLDDEGLAGALAPLGDKRGEESQGRVLVVDDVPLEATLSRQVLERAGFEARELSDELAVLDHIRDFEPDLILMDLNMPRASGAELTAIIRDHEELLLTPIVFLSGEQDADAHQQALALGADEFLTKPVDPKVLVSTVTARLRRSQRMKQRFVSAEDQDEATGLLSRRAFLRSLVLHCTADSDAEGSDCLLFLSIDNVEMLLKHGGLGAEDKLLAHVGAVLRAAVRTSDRVCRFGQHSFVVLAPRIQDDDPTPFARRISGALHDQVLQLGATEHRLSASIGVSRLTRQTDAITQISRAESACWRARNQGPGQIVVQGDKDSASTAPSVQGGLLSETLVTAMAENELAPRYRPIMALTQQGGTQRRFSLEVWLPAEAGPDRRGKRPEQRLDSGGGSRLGELAPLLDIWLMEQAFAAIESEIASGADKVLRLFVPQHMLSMSGRRWILWMRDRIRALGTGALGVIVVVVERQDLLAHLSIANALFPLLGRLRLRLCVRGLDTQPASLSLLQDYPVAFVELEPQVLAAPVERGELDRLVTAAHAQRARVIVTGVDDSATLARVWSSTADFTSGDFIGPAASNRDFDFASSL